MGTQPSFPALGLVLLTGALSASIAGAQPVSRPVYVPQEILLKLRPSSGVAVRSVAQRLGARVIRSFAFIEAHHLRLPRRLSVEKALSLLAADPAVEYAVPNYYRYLDAIPSDPRLGELWGLDNVGQNGGTPDDDIDAPEAWDITTGSSDVVVAVIDSGAQLNHVDLYANIWVNPGEDLNGNGIKDPSDVDGIDSDGNGFIDDLVGWDFSGNDNNPSPAGGGCLGHGTHTAGTIGALGDNGVGVTGVNWNVKLMILKAFNPVLGVLCSANDANLIRAIQYTKLMGVKVSSNSWGGGPFNPAMRDAILATNSLFVAAAGNGGNDGVGDNNDATPSYPASYDLGNIVAVAATDRNDGRARFSNFGRTSVDLGAPGVSILSTVPGNAYAVYSGTSMATPHVAGAAALLLAQDPTYTVNELKDRLLRGVDPVVSLTGRTVTDGRLNALGSLTAPLASATGVTVEISPAGPTSVHRGGALAIVVTFRNNASVPLVVKELVFAKLLSTGKDYVLSGPTSLTRPAGSVLSQQFSVLVPNAAPLGRYRVFGQVTNPDSLDENFIEAEVLP